jgi:hypothetical protein
MAASLMVEEEIGTYTATPHPHNGYYAGDFSRSAHLSDKAPHSPDLGGGRFNPGWVPVSRRP